MGPSSSGQQPQFNQYNAPTSGGTVYSNQGTGNQIINVPAGQPARRKGFGTDSKVLLAFILLDVAYFFYGMLAYSGRNTSADGWRALAFFVLLGVTGGTLRRWLRRRV
jgi:hypothetical protein